MFPSNGKCGLLLLWGYLCARQVTLLFIEFCPFISYNLSTGVAAPSTKERRKAIESRY